VSQTDDIMMAIAKVRPAKQRSLFLCYNLTTSWLTSNYKPKLSIDKFSRTVRDSGI